MNNFTFVQSSREVIVGVPFEALDIPTWLFSLPEATYQSCSVDHVACGSTHNLAGKRMSVNVEVIAGNMMVQHYVEEIAEKGRCRMVSISDLFLPNGRTKVRVIWEMSAAPLTDRACAFTNKVEVQATPEFLDYLLKHSVILDDVADQFQKATDIHNAGEIAGFAESLQRLAVEAGTHSA